MAAGTVEFELSSGFMMCWEVTLRVVPYIEIVIIQTPYIDLPIQPPVNLSVRSWLPNVILASMTFGYDFYIDFRLSLRLVHTHSSSTITSEHWRTPFLVSVPSRAEANCSTAVLLYMYLPVLCPRCYVQDVYITLAG